jgi:hypothetical protein
MQALVSGKKDSRKTELDKLDRDLEEIHEEIRRMYRATTR